MSESSWEMLLDAHRRGGSVGRPAPHRHEPVAAVLACSDARVPPSLVFDQPAGRLFVTRIAGNTATPGVRASLDDAVSELGVDLIVVLGHTGCGAVTAAAEGTCDGYLEPVVGAVCDLARAHPHADVDELAAINVAATVRSLSTHPGPVGRAAAAGSVEIRGAIHDLATGRLSPVPTTDINSPSTALEAS